MRLVDNKAVGFDNNNGGEVGEGACFEYLWGKMGGEVLAARVRSVGVAGAGSSRKSVLGGVESDRSACRPLIRCDYCVP